MASSSISEELRQKGHTQRLQGKEYVLLSGLLDLAHSHGLESIITTPIEINMSEGVAVFSCTVSGERGKFTGHGDSTPRNTGKMVATAFIRMAETRSVCRALRFYLGIGMTARDELPGDAVQSTPPQPKQAPQRRKPGSSWPDVELVAQRIEGLDISREALAQFFTIAPAVHEWGSAMPAYDLLSEQIKGSPTLQAVLENVDHFGDTEQMISHCRTVLGRAYEDACSRIGVDAARGCVASVGRLDQCVDVVIMCEAVDRLGRRRQAG